MFDRIFVVFLTLIMLAPSCAEDDGEITKINYGTEDDAGMAPKNESGTPQIDSGTQDDAEIAPDLVVTNAIPLNDDCVAKVGEEVVQSFGRYDLFCGAAYFVPFEVLNFMVSHGDPERPRSETNIAQFERAEVQLMTPDGAIVVPAFSVPVGGSIVPGDGTDWGEGVVFVELIPAAAVSSLPNPDEVPQIVAEVQLFGKTTGGVEVETGVFRFPIRLCDGCLTFLVDQCIWTEEDIKALNDAKGCQHGGGFDGAFCWCNGRPTTTANQCEFCTIPPH